MLTREQTEFYRDNGYLAVEGVFSDQETAELRDVTDEFVERSRQVTESDQVFDLEPGHTSALPQLRRLKNPSWHHPHYDRVMRHDGMLDIVSQLIGPDLRMSGQKLNMKSADVGSPVEWHQDWTFFPHTNDDLLAVGIAIDDMTEENGCLLVLPGSHKGRIYDHHLDSFFAGAVTEPDFSPDGAVPIEVKAGGVSIHHVRLLHASAPNRSSRPRRLLLFQYCAADAWPLWPLTGAVDSWEGYSDGLVRGTLTVQPRMEAVPVRMPMPPSLRPGSIYETQSVLKKRLLR